MRKLAFEHVGVGSFEMPSMRMVRTEKENSNIVYALKAPKTVYQGSSFTYDRSELLKAALGDSELQKGSSGSFDPKVNLPAESQG